MAMKILINTATTYKGGGLQAAKSFIDECKNFKEHKYHVILGKTLSGLVNPNDYPDNFTFDVIDYRPATKVFRFSSHDADFKKIEQIVKPDVVFTTSGPAYWRPKAPHLVGYNLPHYIYRDSPFFSQLSFYRRIRLDLKGRVIRYFFQQDADAYVVQTEDVNKRLGQWINSEEVYTVSNTCSQDYSSPKKVPNKLPDKKENEFRFLVFSAWYYHKNLPIIAEVVDALSPEIKNNVRFVLTLPDENFSNIFSRPSDSIINLGPIKPDEGPSLYQECDALFLPTLLECFSASYAEAMVMEKPIVTTDLGFARSVCGEAALYYSPVDAHDAAQKVRSLIENKNLSEELIRKGRMRVRNFDSPCDRAQKYLNLCERLVSKKEPATIDG